MKNFSLYIHIPFCAKKCPYCDFNTYAVKAIPEGAYVDAIIAELNFFGDDPAWAERSVQTIFFGGGTPSLFSSTSLHRIIDSCKERFTLEPKAEITMEANPESLNEEKLKSLLEAGINRLSIGAQSFDDKTLKRLGRTHTARISTEAYFNAREIGFENLSLDLMYGIPEQTSQMHYQDLLKTLSLKPDHISSYGLTIEKGTPFYQDQGRGVLKLPEEDLILKMTENISTLLEGAGYRRYEISNYAKSKKKSQHNLAYWNGDDYLGLGAGAHSYIKHSDAYNSGEKTHFASRRANLATVQAYIDKVEECGTAASWIESLSKGESVFEFFFMGLRKIVGVSMVEFSELFQLDIADVYPGLIEDLQAKNLLKINQNHISLSEKGLLLADEVISSFSEPLV